MSQTTLYPVDKNFSKDTWIDQDTYLAKYRQSVENPEAFWAEQSKQFLTWDSPWHSLTEGDFSRAESKWFIDGKLNLTVNCIDRHLPDRADQTAIIWEGDNPSDDSVITYGELYKQVCRLGNLLRQRGVKKGNRVCIYMPMIPEAAYAMLACARIGAIHSVVFGGFSPDALKDRILDADCEVVITADEGVRVW